MGVIPQQQNLGKICKSQYMNINGFFVANIQYQNIGEQYMELIFQVKMLLRSLVRFLNDD